MKNNDWREKLGELSFMKGYYFKLEDNGLVEKKDDQLVFNREELEHFIEQELDRAREEGSFTIEELEVIRELCNFEYEKYVALDLEDSAVKGILKSILSKLTTK